MKIQEKIFMVVVLLIDIFGTFGVIMAAVKLHGKLMERQSAVLSFVLLVCITCFCLALTCVYVCLKIKAKKMDE